MNIDFPCPDQIPQLRALWKKAFGDEDEFLDKFFTLAYAPDRCRCVTENGEVAAMLYWFEDSCRGQIFAYVYAVATDPEYRGRGLCRELMEDTARLLKEQGYAGILLNPASESLARMYEKMGYEPCTTISEFRCVTGEESAPLRQVERNEFARLRREMLPENSVLQEKEDLTLLASFARFYAGADFLAAVTSDGEELRCHELLGNLSAAPGILKSLGMKTGIFRTPGTEKKYVFWLPLTENRIRPNYFGFVLD